jgi:hypothetical protein
MEASTAALAGDAQLLATFSFSCFILFAIIIRHHSFKYISLQNIYNSVHGKPAMRSVE